MISVLDFLYLPTQFPVYPTGICSASIYTIHVCVDATSIMDVRTWYTATGKLL